MSLEKVIDTQTTVLSDGQLQVRTATIIMEDGIELSRSYHRKVIDVGDNVDNEVGIVKAIASKIHTKARIKARQKTLKTQLEQS